MGQERRVSVGVRESYHRQVTELAAITNHKVSALVDLAIRNFLKDTAPVLRRMAEEINKSK